MDIARHTVKGKTLVKQRNCRDRESIQLWPRGANVCDFKSCCPAHECHFDKKSAHCPDTDVRSLPARQQPYLETGRASAGRWSWWRDILTFKVSVWFFRQTERSHCEVGGTYPYCKLELLFKYSLHVSTKRHCRRATSEKFQQYEVS